MLPLKVLLDGHPLRQRLNGMLEAKKVPPAFAARFRRRLGINCDPNECCNRQIAEAFTRAGGELQDEYARFSSVAFEDDAHFRMLLLLAALADKSIAPEALKDRRETECIDACDLSMPEGVGWMKLLDHVVQKTMEEHNKQRWLVWIEPASDTARACHALAISRSRSSSTQGSPLISSGAKRVPPI